MFDLALSLQNDPTLLMNVGAFVLGLCIHIGKKCYMEKISFRDYMMENPGSTSLSLSSLMMAFLYINATYAAAPLAVYLLGGYSIDSLLNKAPLSLSRVNDLYKKEEDKEE